MTLIQESNLNAVFGGFPEIELVYLYGSHASGLQRPDSDLDLAVSAPLADFPELKLDLLGLLALRKTENVDVAFFQQSTPLLRFQMVRCNRLLYCRPDVDAGTLFSRCLNEYFDLEPTLRVQRDAYKERILHG